MAEIHRRKKKLEDDLDLLEGDFEHRLKNVQKKILGKIDPVTIIKENPFKAVGTSVLIGFAIGMIGDKEAPEGEGETGDKHHHKESLSNLLLNELKRIAARRAGKYLSDFVEEKMSKMK